MFFCRYFSFCYRYGHRAREMKYPRLCSFLSNLGDSLKDQHRRSRSREVASTKLVPQYFFPFSWSLCHFIRLVTTLDGRIGRRKISSNKNIFFHCELLRQRVLWTISSKNTTLWLLVKADHGLIKPPYRSVFVFFYFGSWYSFDGKENVL